MQQLLHTDGPLSPAAALVTPTRLRENAVLLF